MILFLIGMMASGKTTVGKQLAKQLDYKFIDTDNEIESLFNLKISEIIKTKGISDFRVLESQVIKNYNYDINTVVSCGGGIILNDENILFMKNNGTVIYLKTPVETLISRLKNTQLTKRPLINNDINNIIDIYQARKDIYDKASEVTINCSDLSVEEIVVEIIKLLVK